MLQPPLGKPWLLFAILGCSLSLNLLMILDRPDAAEAPAAAAPAPTASAAAVAAPAPVSAGLTSVAAPGDPTAPENALAAPPDPNAPPLEPIAGEWQTTEAEVKQSLTHTFQAAVGAEHAAALSAVYTRLFVWDIDMRRDLQQGDKVRVAWRLDDKGIVEIAAASFRSRKFGRTYAAYRWQPPGEPFPSYWRTSGEEVPPRLTDGPLDSYEQITSLLKDRPTHKGMDFKTPVGTPIRSPRSGTVTRVNWNWAANGNCVEVKFDDGTLAKFLHLDELKITAGARVQAKQVIALTGNTGRSTAPHLHYQLDRGEQNIDPLDYHGTSRRQLPQEVMPTFLQEVERLNKLLDSAS